MGSKGGRQKQTKTTPRIISALSILNREVPWRNSKAREPQGPSRHFTICKGGEAESPANAWRKALEAQGAPSQDPEVEMGLVCSRHSKKASSWCGVNEDKCRQRCGERVNF